MAKKEDKSIIWSLATGELKPEQMIFEWVTNYLKEKYGPDGKHAKKIPLKVRFQHLLAVGRSGCGKSSFLYDLMAEDIPECLAEKRTMIYIDPVTGIDRVLEETYISRHPNVFLIDMADPDSLPRLSLFETGVKREGIGATSYMINTFIDVCSGLIDQDMTTNMRTLFSRCAVVMQRVENHTLHDLLDLLNNPLEYIEEKGFEAGEQIHDFFVDDVIGKPGKQAVYKDTIKYLRGRIQTFLGDPVICRLLINREPTMRLSRVIEEGSIVLVATRKSDTGVEGCRLVGKFIKSVIKRVVQERSRKGTSFGVPIMLYEDEFQNSLSSKGTDHILASMLDEDRKFGLSVNIATTRFGKLSSDMGDAAMTCTATKVVGTSVGRITTVLATELGVTGAEITQLPNFKLFVKSGDKMDRAVKIDTTEFPFKKIGPRKKDTKAIHRLRESMNQRFGEGYVRRIQYLERTGEEERTFTPEDQAVLASGAPLIEDVDM